MSITGPLTILLASEHAEDIKSLTMSLRAAFTGCHLEAVYSAEETLEWAAKQAWHVILGDHALWSTTHPGLREELKRRAPGSSLILIVEQMDPSTPLQAWQAGYNACLWKGSPAFLSEVALAIRHSLDLRDLRHQLDASRERYTRLVDTMSDRVYELDASGRFTWISPQLATDLGYSLQDLAGSPYTMIMPAERLSEAKYRFNERRTGDRATSKVTLQFLPAASRTTRSMLWEGEVSATGCYSPQKQFLGTVGIIRHLYQVTHSPEDTRLSPSTVPAPILTEQPELSPLIHQQTGPLADFLVQEERLLTNLRQLNEPQVVDSPPAPIPAPQEISPSEVPPAQDTQELALHDLIDEVLSLKADDFHTHHITIDLTRGDLPPVVGNKRQLQQVFFILITQLELALWNLGRGGRVVITAHVEQVANTPSGGHAVPRPLFIIVHLRDAARLDSPQSQAWGADQDPTFRLAATYIQQHRGTLERLHGQEHTLHFRLALPSAPHSNGIGAPTEHATNPHLPPIPEPLAKHQNNPPPAPTSSIRSVPERRRTPRMHVGLSASLMLGGTTWQGNSIDLSRGGMALRFDRSIPMTENQPILIGLMNDVGVLELEGTIRALRKENYEDTAESNSAVPPTILAVEYASLTSVDEQILRSLLTTIQERPSGVTVAAIVNPRESGDLLCEIGHWGQSETLRSPSQPQPFTPPSQASAERRMSTRFRVSLPVRFVTDPNQPPQDLPTGFLNNLSMSGACLRLSEPLEAHRQITVYLPPPELLDKEPSRGFTSVAEIPVPAEIVWMTPAPSTPQGPARTESAGRIGLRFVHLEEGGRRRVSDLVGSLLTDTERVSERRRAHQLTSQLGELRNASGQRLSFYHDHPKTPLPPGSPIVLIVPGYGETKKDYIQLAYCLAANGFHVLRYDHSHHVGESDGEVRHTTLSQMGQDMEAMLEYSTQTWPLSPIVVVATSLSGRVALRVSAEDRRVNLLILLAGVVDVQATLQAVHQDDVVAAHLHGRRHGHINLMGLTIDADQWLEDATLQGLTDIQQTLQDAERITIPVLFFAPEQDTWVDLQSVKRVHISLAAAGSRLFVISEGLHRLNENPSPTRTVCRHIVTSCREHFFPLTALIDMVDPSVREIGLQSRLERERARAHHHMTKTQVRDFWKDDLQHSHHLVNVPAYWHTLEQVYRLLGTPNGKARLLDAGCGNGNLGLYLMIHHAYRERHASRVPWPALHYVGIDLVPSALRQAGHNLSNMASGFLGPVGDAWMTHPPIISSFCQTDLNVPLPFADHQFDRIACHLALNFVDDPLTTLRELLRVLAPYGRLVFTMFKPQANLASLCRSLFACARDGTDQHLASTLLRKTGTLREMEIQQQCRSFDAEELTRLLQACGVDRPRIFSSLADQAYLVVIEK
jgi:PAS domain S-box-containing protein